MTVIVTRVLKENVKIVKYFIFTITRLIIKSLVIISSRLKTKSLEYSFKISGP